MKRVVVGLLLAAISVIASAADPVTDRYNKACVVCHASGVANAPRFGSAEDWKPRLAKGIDKLVLSVKNGFNAMPPRGMCNDCSDTDYQALIQFMSTPKK
ncbi:MAG: hypothetical protein JWM78_1999 [Verrucomicrobiaceae bacterium]|nr:hypothetical protein [Verrucomicrobiaceae bacterium]